MGSQDVSESGGGSGRPRSTGATVSDIGLILLGLALIVSAFSNVPAQVSGSLVSVGLAAPGAPLVRVVFGVVGTALLLLGLANLVGLAHYAAKAWLWWKRQRQRPPRREPGVNVGVPPRPSPLFRGRERELKEVAIRLAMDRRVDLSGLGGVGKTSLAVAYLHRHRAEYPDGVFWLRGENETTLLGDFADLAWLPPLYLPERTEGNLDLIIRGVTRWLVAHPRWLLVVDDLDQEQIPTLKRLLARDLEGHILVCCRIPVWNRTIEVGPMDPELATDYLLERTGQDDRTSAASVGQMLEHLPLALEQAAAYIHDTGCPLATYAELARTRLTEIMREGRPPDYPNPVATTWRLSFARIEQESAAATAVLRLCACLAPDGIPLAMLRRAAGQLHGDFAVALGDVIGLDLAVGTLRRYAMVTRQDETLRIHRLVQGAVRDSPTQHVWTAVILRVLRETFPTEVEEPSTWAACASLAPHIQAALGMTGADEVLEPVATSWLLDRLGLYLYARGEFHAARPLFELALEIRERALGPEHPDTVSTLTNLGWVLWLGVSEPAARPLFERALQIREQVLGPEHPDTASSLHCLGSLLITLGELAAARPLIVRALEIRERVLGPEDPDTVWTFTNLAWVLRWLGEFPASRRLWERSLAIREKVLGPEHLDTAWSLTGLGWVLQDQGEMAAARPLFERVLGIRERVLGPEHPYTARSLKDLAGLLRELGELAAARPLSERALAITERVPGPDHPDTAWTLNGLALVLQEQGEVAAAKPLFERALQIRERLLGAEHLYTVWSLNNLGWLLRDQHNLVAARPMLERALEINQRLLGPGHPHTAKSLNDLGIVLADQGHLPSARSMLERALEINQRVFGPDHPYTARSLDALAGVRRNMGEFDVAQSLFERALEIRERVLGHDHMRTITTRRSLYELLAPPGDHAGTTQEGDQ